MARSQRARQPGIVTDVTDLIHRVHPERRTYQVRAPGTTVIQSYWRHWPCLLPQHGPGRKHERRLGIQPWQQAIIDAHPAEFLRGLFHSDGCRVRNWATRKVAGEVKRYEYPRWQLQSLRPSLRGLRGARRLRRRGSAERSEAAARRLEIRGARTISVSRRTDVARLDALIGLKR